MEDMTHLQWEDPGWLEPLHRLNVLDYFMNSPFFDSNSNNIKARKEGKNSAEPGVLESMGPGLEYAVAHAQEPHLFIICRQERDPKGKVQAQAFFYIIDRKVHQAPSLHAAITTRLQRCLFNIQQAFCKLQHDLDPLARLLQEEERKRVDPGAEAARQAEAAQKPMPVRQKLTHEEADRWRRFDNMIIDVLQKNKPPQLPDEYFQAAAPPQQVTDTSDPPLTSAPTPPAPEGPPAASSADTPPPKRQRI